jgi:hypothetical protein
MLYRGVLWRKTRKQSFGGRIYTTALATLMLEVYYRYSSDGAKVYEGQPTSAPATAPAGNEKGMAKPSD